jgi:hypothetical protein
MNAKLIIFITIAIVLNGCATQPQAVWYKSGSSAQEFEMDRGQCNAKAFSLASGNLYQIAIIQNQCLQGKGWYLTDPKHLANINNELSTERANNRKQHEAMCASAEFESIYAKTPCFANAIEFKFMTDETKITQPQKQVFIKWRETVDASIQQTLNFEVRLGGSAGKKFASSFATYKADHDKNNVDLYNGKITWGQYNGKRKEIYLKIMEAIK